MIFIFASLGPGGAERNFIRLANEVSLSSETIIVVLTKKSDVLRPTISSRIKIIQLNKKHVKSSLLSTVRILDEIEPHILVAALTHVNILAILASLFARHKPIVSISERNLRHRSPKSFFKHGILDLLIKIVYRRADIITAVSLLVRKQVAKRAGIPEEVIEVIYNPISLAHYDLSGSVIPHPWLRPHEPPVILAVGSLTRKKNFRILVKAFKLCAESEPMRLIILGEGPQRTRLQKLVKKLGLTGNVLLPGYVSNPLSWMQFARLFVSVSRVEGTSNVILEAMTVGLPVVATEASGSSRETLMNGKCGNIVLDKSVDSLANGIIAAVRTERSELPSECLSRFRLGVTVTKFMQVHGL